MLKHLAPGIGGVPRRAALKALGTGAGTVAPQPWLSNDFGGFGEALPRKENRVTLDPQMADEVRVGYSRPALQLYDVKNVYLPTAVRSSPVGRTTPPGRFWLWLKERMRAGAV